MNFAFFGMLNRFKKFEHDWELKHLQNKASCSATVSGHRIVLKTLSETGTRFEFECYDTAHLYNLNYSSNRAMVKAAIVRGRRCSACRAAPARIRRTCCI